MNITEVYTKLAEFLSNFGRKIKKVFVPNETFLYINKRTMNKNIETKQLRQVSTLQVYFAHFDLVQLHHHR